MSERIAASANPFSGAIVGIILAIGLFSFTAAFALMGWAPDLADKDRAGPHPYSTSALGYQGLVRLLEADGQSVFISRSPDGMENYDQDLLVVTIPENGFSRLRDFDPVSLTGPALYVLPKWRGRVDRDKRSWQIDTDLISSSRIAGLLEPFDEDAKIWRLRNPGPIDTEFGTVRPDFGHEMQVIESGRLIPVIKVPGGSLVSRVPGTRIYILSDPDILNTFGLARRENARLALGLLEYLKPNDESYITLDATIHGFEHTDNLLKAIFNIPYLGVTLLAFATMLLVGWSASVRTAPPQRETRPIAFGKQALADNSAGLIAMARRETAMAPRYLEATRRALIRKLGLPRSTDETTLGDTLNRLAKQNGREQKFENTARPLTAPAKNREDLTEKARRLWHWRKEITHGD